jgi:hypothetical protein
MVLQFGVWTLDLQPCSVKIYILGKFKEVKTRTILAESSKEDYSLERAVLPNTIIIITTRALESPC